MSGIQLHCLGPNGEPKPGNSQEAGGVLNPAAASFRAVRSASAIPFLAQSLSPPLVYFWTVIPAPSRHNQKLTPGLSFAAVSAIMEQPRLPAILL